jgi:LysR family hydrogen peroxide-inducible transcriptional activator
VRAVTLRVAFPHAGVVVIEQARRILLAAAELGEIARHAADPFRGTLRLGVIPTVGPYLLPDLTPTLATRFSAALDRLD